MACFDELIFARQNFVSPIAQAVDIPRWHIESATLRYSCRTTLKREVLMCRPPLYLIKPSFLNLFIKKLTLERVVPIISASVSCEILGITPWGWSSFP